MRRNASDFLKAMLTDAQYEAAASAARESLERYRLGPGKGYRYHSLDPEIAAGMGAFFDARKGKMSEDGPMQWPGGVPRDWDQVDLEGQALNLGELWDVARLALLGAGLDQAREAQAPDAPIVVALPAYRVGFLVACYVAEKGDDPAKVWRYAWYSGRIQQRLDHVMSLAKPAGADMEGTLAHRAWEGLERAAAQWAAWKAWADALPAPFDLDALVQDPVDGLRGPRKDLEAEVKETWNPPDDLALDVMLEGMGNWGPEDTLIQRIRGTKPAVGESEA